MADSTTPLGRPRESDETELQLLVNADVDNSNKTFTVGTGEQWRVRSVFVDNVTTATAGNRIVTVRFTTAANASFAATSAAAQAASLTNKYTFVPDGQVATGGSAVHGAVYPLPNLWLFAGQKIQVLDAAAVDAAADDMTVRIVYERFKFSQS